MACALLSPLASAEATQGSPPVTQALLAAPEAPPGPPPDVEAAPATSQAARHAATPPDAAEATAGDSAPEPSGRSRVLAWLRAPKEPLGYGHFDRYVTAGSRTNYWVLGMAAEQFTSAATELGSGGNLLLGLTAMWRIKAFGPHLLLMTKPAVERFIDARYLGGGGLRGLFTVGSTQLSYGVSSHMEIRLADHFWLMYATPIELGVTLWDRGSWNIDLFLGMRRVMTGSLINYFLIDPNGFDNEVAQDEVDAAQRGPWRAFARVVFGRRVD